MNLSHSKLTTFLLISSLLSCHQKSCASQAMNTTQIKENKQVTPLSASTLNDLIKVCKDGEQGFQTAAENATDAQLKTIFLDKSTHFQHLIHDLQESVLKMKQTPEDQGNMTGALYRGWMIVKSALTDHENEALLVECERGLKMALSAYQHILTEDLSVEDRAFLQRQHDLILADHTHIYNLKTKYETKEVTTK